MDVRQLKYFLAIVNQGSITKASDVLGIAQPSLGAHIRNLEEELGTQLLIRTSRGVHLTKAGSILFDGAQQIVASLSDLKKTVIDSQEEQRGDVRLGITPSLADRLLIALIAECKERHPKIDLSVTEGLSHSLVELIEMQQIDLALAFDLKPSHNIKVHTLGAEEICFVTKDEEKYGSIEVMDFRDLETQQLILPPRPSRIRILAEEAAAQCGIALNIAFEMHSLPTILRLVEHGYGATLISASGTARHTNGTSLLSRPVVNPSLRHHVSLVRHAWAPPSRAEAAVAAILEALVITLPELTRP